MERVHRPKRNTFRGCFRAADINATWEQVKCVAPPPIPLAPAAVGDGYDYSAYSGAPITSSAGSFESITGFVSENDSSEGPNSYTLQDNSNFFLADTAYTGLKQTRAWEQFVFQNSPALGGGYVFISYWLLGYYTEYGHCPTTIIPGGDGWSVSSGDCYADGPGTLTPLVLASDLGSVTLTGFADANSNDEAYLCITGGSCYGVGGTAQVLDLYQEWNYAEFNFFGYGDYSTAKFNVGTTITVSNILNVAATCESDGFTGEKNNLYLGNCSTNSTDSDQIVFRESYIKSPTLTTALTPVGIAPGGSVNDTATLVGAARDASGMVTYNWYGGGQDSSCTGQFVSDQVDVTDGVVPDSISYGPLAAGTYSWQVVYSGDSLDHPATSTCEPLTLTSATVSQPIELTIKEFGGPPATFTINGCGADSSTVPGDGTTYTITMQASCSFDLSYSNSGGSARYGIVRPNSTIGQPGTFSPTLHVLNSCAVGSCPVLKPGYDLQERLTVSGGFGVSFSWPSETGDGWYLYGDTLDISSNGIGTRTAGVGSRVSSWEVDGGPVTAVATAGTVTTSVISMKAAHQVTFSLVTQYQLTLATSGRGTATANTQPTITGDQGWYDAGTVVGISAKANKGSVFVSWTGSGSVSYTGRANPTKIAMDSPITETAKFRLL
jgi:hypothetical protein